MELFTNFSLFTHVGVFALGVCCGILLTWRP